ncbi:cyclin-like protein [Didymella exigua CBS 183.55]|uniref:RNA polymerase II holoenzyme cyclin-like subunit n=1 Tax=Didymella exigua CBS 183.55 TaxID=1150837 RepID=A0A6A5S259_9PLEO|nr:cyclin-like protein [Didymella exigua CBS 183.55]KAF1933494.1 cyclin-like protein [Didymella exigua CBS 183.55]
MKLSEDDLYRTSTQFRQWSFTAEQLAAQRAKTNLQATERVKLHVARQRAQRAQAPEIDSTSGNSGIDTGANTPDAVTSDKDVDCFTVAEELAFLEEFCERTMALGQHCKFSDGAIATCIQFLRRFYLYNSPMTYHAQNISRTAMFLAGKSESEHQSLDKFAEAISSVKTKVTPEQILAPEYLIVQALRFNFDIKHPFRALKGGMLDLMSVVNGRYEGPNHSPHKTAADLSTALHQLPRKAGGTAMRATTGQLTDRIMAESYSKASQILKKTAPLTDVYFLYTPSQIWLSAYLLADEPLVLFYLSIKLPSTSPIYDKVIAALRECASILSSHRSYRKLDALKDEQANMDAEHKSEIKRLIKKLRTCQDPDKVDLVKLNQAQKRDAVQGSDLDEHKAKRRKTDRENFQKDSDAFWGPELPQNGDKPA